MAKKIKMVLYGEPGTGKSVFACKAPKPFFICTDGNYEWLEDFGADMDAHVDVYSWSEMKKILSNESLLNNYETIVIDLLEDAFKWCESEFCARNRIEHLSDMGYGKGYDITRTEFFIEMSKLISIDKNIILIMHGMDVTKKDRRGVEHTHHVPSPRIPDKLLDNIEGRVRYFLRCYVKGEEEGDGSFIKKRYLSVVPKENEFGICRGIDENRIPHDIPLEWDEFTKVIGVTASVDEKEVEKPRRATKKASLETRTPEKTVEVIEPVKETTTAPADNSEEPIDYKIEPKDEPKDEEKKTQVEEKIEEKLKKQILESAPVKNEPVNQESSNQGQVSAAEKMAAIKNKLAALKKSRE